MLATVRCSTQEGSGITQDQYWTGLKKLAVDKHSSLFCHNANGEEQKLKILTETNLSLSVLRGYSGGVGSYYYPRVLDYGEHDYQ